jgi:hypothetical protein
VLLATCVGIVVVGSGWDGSGGNGLSLSVISDIDIIWWIGRGHTTTSSSVSLMMRMCLACLLLLGCCWCCFACTLHLPYQ